MLFASAYSKLLVAKVQAGKPSFFDFYSPMITFELRNAKQNLVPDLRQKFQANEIIAFCDVMVCVGVSWSST